ncbi:MAG: FAD-dependent oxidoreductase [Actinomycetota bacterium]|nr:FAD-dependent oxidoreductase [Actinomycetota bacterium]
MTDYDVLVLGSGIGGMESALKLGDMGYRVLVVESEPSIGGKMILLSKVFPTLDCASCISTPKMAATAHHPNVSVLTDARLERVVRMTDGGFSATIHQTPRYVDVAACTACRQCELACTVAVPDQYNGELVSRRAAYLPFPQALPQKALIERAGTSPCTFACPAGIKAHGYVSLVRSGEYDKAFALVSETTPLVGSLGRACYAPCEAACTRGALEGPLAIRRLKRFVADVHYGSDGNHEAPARPEPSGKRVAIVGSGPAGVTAAWQLARAGHAVRIFEAAPVAGGAMRLSIPSYRLPVATVERDLANLAELGVEIETGHLVRDLAELRAGGFDAVLVATGTPLAARLGVAGEDLDGVRSALGLLRDLKLGAPVDLTDRTVAVIGGGNVAIDAARSAARLGARSVHLVCLEQREHMPAHAFEVEEALAEGIELHDGWGIADLSGSDAVASVGLKACTAVFDADGRFAPTYDDRRRAELGADVVLVAIGMEVDTAAFPSLAPAGSRRLRADPATFRTAEEGVFAAGDAVSGPSTIAQAVGAGRDAAHMIDRYLSGKDLAGLEVPLPVVSHDAVLARQRAYTRREAFVHRPVLSPAPRGFAELEGPLSEDEALAAAGRCLDCGVCSECHECVAACPADAIHLEMRPEDHTVRAGAVIVSTGYRLFDADLKPQYGYGRFKNVVTGTQMERLLAPTRPYHGVLRPGDGKVPEKIAYVMCTGSRDETVNNPMCSKFCCMYSLKQNQLILGALPLADVTVHYIDIRAAGKGYDEFFEQAKAMGTTFIKGRVAEINELENGDLMLSYEDIAHGGVRVAEYDLVVLAVGVQPSPGIARLFEDGLELDPQGFVLEVSEDDHPAATSIPGVFAAGAVTGPRDIPESILHAGAAAVQAAAYLQSTRVPA